MKKSLIIYICIAVIFTAAVGGLSFFGYRYFTGDKPLTVNNDPQEETEEEEIIDTDPIFNSETMPILDGSTVAIPFMDAIYADFTGVDVTEVKKTYSMTQPAYDKLIEKKADLIIVTSPSKDALKYAKKKKIELEVTPVLTDGFIFFVNKKNVVNELSLEQIVDIYSGKITNWKKVGGDDVKITAYQRPVNSGSQTGMLKLVMKKVKMKKAKIKEIPQLMSDTIKVVSNYTGQSSGIAYSYYYYANEMYVSDDIKFIAVDGVMPSFASIQEGSYPLMTNYFIVTRKDDPNPNVEILKQAILSKRGQKLASDNGYIPVKAGENN